MARRVNFIKVPFNYKWPGVSAVSCIREAGELLVKDEVADAAVAAGFATETKAPAPKQATGKRKAAIAASDEAAQPDTPADAQPVAGMDRGDLADDDRADGAAPVADAG
jgi:hypothetical protein